jgi:hypothetical protein
VSTVPSCPCTIWFLAHVTYLSMAFPGEEVQSAASLPRSDFQRLWTTAPYLTPGVLI